MKEFIKQGPGAFDEILFIAFNDDVFGAYSDTIPIGLKSIGDIMGDM